MSDNSTLNPGSGGDTIRTIDRVTAKTQVVTLDLGGAGAESLVAGSVPVSGSINVSNFPATQAISGAVSVSNFPASQAVTGPLTDTQLRASAVSVSLASTTITGNVTVAQATAANLNAQVVGSVASAAADSGNPVKIGGTFNTTQPTVTTGQRVDAQMTARGAQIVATGADTFTVTVGSALPTGANVIGGVTQSGTWTVQPGNTANTTAWLVTQAGLVGTAAALTDALANPTLGPQSVLNSVFNGTTWDRQRGMSTALTTGDTGAKTATGNGATQTNVGNKGIQIFIILGAVTGTTPTCVFKLQGSVDGGINWYNIPGATTASLTASTNVGITVYPGATVLAGTTTTGTTAVASNVLPRNWRMVWTIGGTTPSFTITSITYNYLVN